MKEPKAGRLRIDDVETRRVKKIAEKSRAVKITINLDSRSLAALKREAAKTGVPYQRLLNRVLREGLNSRDSAEERLRRLEREVSQMKKKLTA